MNVSEPPYGGREHLKGRWAAQLRRCLRQKQPKRSRGKHSDRILWMKQGAVFGAALRFSQAGTAPRRENRPSARGKHSDRVLRTKQGAVFGAALRFLQAPSAVRSKNRPSARGKHSDRVLRTKQGAVFGAALRFLQAPAAARRKNRLSARGTRSAFCKRASPRAAKTGHRNPEGLEQSQKILQMPDPSEISSSSFRFGKARVFSSECPPTLPL